MTHENYREMIQREMDGDLSDLEIARLDEHVVTCADCRQEREQLQTLSSVFGKIGNVKPDRSFVPQMAPELPQYVQSKRRFASQWMRGLSVAAVVVLAIGFSTNWQYGLGTQPASDRQEIASVQETNREKATQPEQPTEVPEQVTIQQNTEQTTAAVEPPKLIAQETVTTKPQVKVVAASSGDVSKVESQTGVKIIDTKSKPAAGGVTVANSNEMVVAAVDATATDVKVDGNKVTVTLRPVENKTGNSEVNVFGIAATTPGTNTVTFTDEDGNVISTTSVEMPPSDEVIGANTKLTQKLNEQTQAQAKQGGEYAWATDSYEVVQRHLTDLGFATNAQVVATNLAEVVHVTQGAVLYEVKLQQPYEQGKAGIWRPVQVSRLINVESSLQSFEHPIIDYFNDLKASGKVAEVGSLYVTSPLSNNRVTISVDLSKKDAKGQLTDTKAIYDFTLKQGADGAWVLASQPSVR